MSLLHRSSSVPVMSLTQTWSDSSTLQPDLDDDHVPLFELGAKVASPHFQPANNGATNGPMTNFEHPQAQAQGFNAFEKRAQLRKSVSFCLTSIDLELQFQAFRSDSNVSGPSHKSRAPQKGLLKVSHSSGSLATMKQMPASTLLDLQDDIPIALLWPGALQERSSLDQGTRSALIHSDEIKLAPPDVVSTLANDLKGLSEGKETDETASGKPPQLAGSVPQDWQDPNKSKLLINESLSRKASTSAFVAPDGTHSTTIKWNWIWHRKRVYVLDRRVLG
ncbi:hypothetical protein BC830DRAFT_1148234 [Chytriomyces sp. MP71]|nr:hypothetical protein BC830DRAFT_1148234 [Chytriomyces sp. MP71]